MILIVRKAIFRDNRGIIKANSVCANNFDTLFTSLPHSNIQFVISKIIDSALESSSKEFNV